MSRPRNCHCMSLQSCPIPCDPMGWSPWGGQTGEAGGSGRDPVALPPLQRARHSARRPAPPVQLHQADTGLIRVPNAFLITEAPDSPSLTSDYSTSRLRRKELITHKTLFHKGIFLFLASSWDKISVSCLFSITQLRAGK